MNSVSFLSSANQQNKIRRTLRFANTPNKSSPSNSGRNTPTAQPIQKDLLSRAAEEIDKKSREELDSETQTRRNKDKLQAKFEEVDIEFQKLTQRLHKMPFFQNKPSK